MFILRNLNLLHDSMAASFFFIFLEPLFLQMDDSVRFLGNLNLLHDSMAASFFFIFLEPLFLQMDDSVRFLTISNINSEGY